MKKLTEKQRQRVKDSARYDIVMRAGRLHVSARLNVFEGFSDPAVQKRSDGNGQTVHEAKEQAARDLITDIEESMNNLDRIGFIFGTDLILSERDCKRDPERLNVSKGVIQ